MTCVSPGSVPRNLPVFVCAVVAAVLTVPAIADEGSSDAAVEDHTFIAEFDGSEQRYVTMLSSNVDLNQAVSVLIALHGHGADRWQFIRQERGECRAVRDVAAARGLLLVSPDYRASTSWMGPTAEADVLQMIELLKSQHNVNAVIVCGGSMGGTSALILAARHPNLVDGVVAFNGTANMLEYARFQDAIAASYGGTRQEVPQEYRRRSAELFPERFRMPLAVTTGGRDEIVSPDSTLRLVQAVKRHQRHVLSLHRPAGGHSTDYQDSRRALEFVVSAVESTR